MDPNEEFSTFYICIDMVLFPLLHSYKNLASNIDISILRYFRPQLCVDTEWLRCSHFPSSKIFRSFRLVDNFHSFMYLVLHMPESSQSLLSRVWLWEKVLSECWLDYEGHNYLRLRCLTISEAEVLAWLWETVLSEAEVLALLNTSQDTELHLYRPTCCVVSCASSCWNNTCGITISPLKVSIDIGSFGRSFLTV